MGCLSRFRDQNVIKLGAVGLLHRSSGLGHAAANIENRTVALSDRRKVRGAKRIQGRTHCGLNSCDPDVGAPRMQIREVFRVDS